MPVEDPSQKPQQEEEQTQAKDEGGDPAGQNRPGLLNVWGGRAALTLQGVYNKLVAGRVNQIQAQVIDQDRELSEMARDQAELIAQISQMNRRLQEVEERLAQLEAGDKLADVK